MWPLVADQTPVDGPHPGVGEQHTLDLGDHFVFLKGGHKVDRDGSGPGRSYGEDQG